MIFHFYQSLYGHTFFNTIFPLLPNQILCTEVKDQSSGPTNAFGSSYTYNYSRPLKDFWGGLVIR
jgi:hypothetical protein